MTHENGNDNSLIRMVIEESKLSVFHIYSMFEKTGKEKRLIDS